jgi:hypothetical protein
VGVRFRSRASWQKLFEEAEFEIVRHRTERNEAVSAPRRLLLVKNIRREYFLLRAAAA